MWAPGEKAGRRWAMPCELSRGRASILGFQPHIPARGPCGVLEEVGGKMRGFDGTNNAGSTRLEAGTGGSGPQKSLCRASLLPSPRQRGRNQRWGGGGAIPRGFSLPYNFPPCSDGWISRPSSTFPIPCWPGPRGCEIPISVGSGWDKVNGM